LLVGVLLVRILTPLSASAEDFRKLELLTYCHPLQQGLEEDVVLREALDNLSIFRNVDEDHQGILGYRRVVLNE